MNKRVGHDPHLIRRLLFPAMVALCAAASHALVAPSVQPPGGLAPSNTPQIVLLTFDDTVTANSFLLVQGVLTNHVNPNGHPIKATFFVSLDSKVDYGLVNKLYAAGHEIAIHTMTHSTSTNTDRQTFRQEIVGCRKALSQYAAIPLADIVGFRAPYLKFNNNSFQILAEQGLRYDANLLEWPGSFSTNAAQYLWPYTLENGVAQTNSTGAFPIQPVPGVFEIPMWNQVTNGVSAVSMDPPDWMDYSAVTALWRTNFLLHYEGNRAPYGIYLHATTPEQWLSNTNYPWRSGALNDFITWAHTHSNVWFLATRDLADFMDAPVSANQASTSLVFQTTTHTPYPTNLISRCSNIGNINVCGACPLAYPAPTNMYAEAVPIAPGMLTVSMNSNAFNSIEFHLSYSNNTAETAVDWETVFTFPTNVVFVNAYSSSFLLTTNGGLVNLTLKPKLYLLPLLAGRSETNVYFALKGLTSTNAQIASSALSGLRPIRPLILDFTRETSDVQMVWDDSAYGYSVEWTTGLAAQDWHAVTNVYGKTSWTWDTPASVTNAFFRVLGVP